MFKSVATAIVLVASTSSAFAMGAVENQVSADAAKISKLKTFAGEVVQTLVEERADNQAALDKYNEVTSDDESSLTTAVKTGAYGVKFSANFITEWNDLAEDYDLRTVSGTKLNDGNRETIINAVEYLAFDLIDAQEELVAAEAKLDAIQAILDEADTTDVDDFISDLQAQLD